MPPHAGELSAEGQKAQDHRVQGLCVEGLAAFRGERLVFRDLTFWLPLGGALLLLGANGSGKSTLLRLLAGLLRPAAGSVFWNGAEVFDDLAAHGPQVGYLGHLEAIKPGLTASENLRFAAATGSGRDAVPAALEALQLTRYADLPARLLSAGQRRRLAFVRLTLSAAKLWLLDEPTLGLDLASVARLGDILAQHRANGGAIVAATHLDLPLPGAETLDLSAQAPAAAPS